MTATIHRLHNSTSVASYLRVGHRDHKWLEDQLARGALPYRRFVFEAAFIQQQRQLVSLLRETNCGIVLDTNFAELSSIGKFQGASRHLPWAHPDDRPWTAEDLVGNRAEYVASQIAEFAVEEHVDAILSPNGLIDAGNDWLTAGVRMNAALYRTLQRSGGNHISLDYQLIGTMALLREADFRADVKAVLHDVAAENVWLRTSGHDANSTGTGNRRYVEAVCDLHEISRPFIADMTGGFPALSAAAAGAIGGFSFGVGQKEAFRANDYKRVPVGGGGGGAKRIYVNELGRWISEDQFVIMTQAKGAKPKLICRDTSCCTNGKDDMIDNHNGHFLKSRAAQIEQISRVPDDRREADFQLKHIGPALRTARALARLDYGDEKTLKTILDEKKRLTLMNDVLADMLVDSGNRTRSEAPLFRGNTNSLVILGRGA
jgi:hypothetical protein